MHDIFVEREWANLCDRVRQSASTLGSRPDGDAEAWSKQAESFCTQSPPERYPELLQRVGEAAKLAVGWQQNVDSSVSQTSSLQQRSQTSSAETGSPHARELARPHAHDKESDVDEAVDESFPASDPPAWTATTIS